MLWFSYLSLYLRNDLFYWRLFEYLPFPSCFYHLYLHLNWTNINTQSMWELIKLMLTNRNNTVKSKISNQHFFVIPWFSRKCIFSILAKNIDLLLFLGVGIPSKRKPIRIVNTSNTSHTSHTSPTSRSPPKRIVSTRSKNQDCLTTQPFECGDGRRFSKASSRGNRLNMKNKKSLLLRGKAWR